MNQGLRYQHLQEKWKRLYEEGMSFRQIAKLDNVDAKTVNRTLNGLVEIRPKSKWDAYADEWYNLLTEEKYTKSKIAKKYQTNIGVVSRVLSLKGIESKTIKSKRKYDHLEKNFIEMYESGASLSDIENTYGVNHGTVFNYLKKAGIQVRDLSQAIRKYYLNENYFDVIDSEQKAYYLGLLFGTGSLLELHNSYALQLTMHVKDKHILDPLVRVLRGDDIGGYLPEDNVVRYRFNSKHLYQTLKEWGMDVRKKIRFPIIEEQLYPAFLSGYMVNKSYTTKGKNSLYISGSRYFLQSLKELLSKQVNGDKLHIYEITKNEYRFAIYDSEVIEAVRDWVEVF